MKAAPRHRRVQASAEAGDVAGAGAGAGAGEVAAHPLRPQCPCCAPQAEFKRPSQRLAERLAALRERQLLPLG